MMSINDCLILSVDKCTVQREDDFKEVDFRGRCYFGMLQHTSCYAEEILESHFFKFKVDVWLTVLPTSEVWQYSAELPGDIL